MGALLSLAGPKSNHYTEVLHCDSRKRQRTSFHDTSRLIPDLPDEISILILARLPRICYLNLRSVSPKWRDTIMSPDLFLLRKQLGITEEWLYVLTKAEDDKLFWHALDPSSGKWQRLPQMMSNNLQEEESNKGFSSFWNMTETAMKISEFVKRWMGRKDAMDLTRFTGSGVCAVNGYMYLVGGFSRSSTLKCVWRFDPILNKWSEVNSMSTGRAYCKTAILNNKLYAVGGVSKSIEGLAPLRSAEVYDPQTDTWSAVPSMPFSKVQSLPIPFFFDMLKPIATGMISYLGKLFVPQSLYSWPFFVDVGGEIYDPHTNSWAEMPVGMGDGWPARQSGVKGSVVLDNELYAFDPSSSQGTGKIKVYDQQEDAWKVVISKVPIGDLRESESPCLLAGFYGKLHVIAKNADRQITVQQADLQEDLCNFRSGLTSSPDGSLDGHSNLLDEIDTVVWKVIASRDFGSAELVSCQVLEI